MHIMHPVQGKVWCLHRVVAERSIFPSNRELEITPDYLERLIVEHQRSGFQFVSLDKIVDDIHRRPLDLRRKKRINITFDDGFRDVYDNAFPILRKHHIPFTVYLVSNFPEKNSDIWWIHLERYAHGNVDWFEKTMKEIYQSSRNMRDVMHEKTESEPDRNLCKDLALSWSQLREMVDSGLCTIGSHSMTHPSLTRISMEEVRHELTESKRIIEEHLPIRVEHFSYPHSMESPEIQAMLKETGYKTATMGYGGKVRKGDNLYKLNRRYITL
jgi:peptidoglycan/xylan/chitin deacetylase (PgdA/CDA1 family)